MRLRDDLNRPDAFVECKFVMPTGEEYMTKVPATAALRICREEPRLRIVKKRDRFRIEAPGDGDYASKTTYRQAGHMWFDPDDFIFEDGELPTKREYYTKEWGHMFRVHVKSESHLSDSRRIDG